MFSLNTPLDIQIIIIVIIIIIERSSDGGVFELNRGVLGPDGSRRAAALWRYL